MGWFTGVDIDVPFVEYANEKARWLGWLLRASPQPAPEVCAWGFSYHSNIDAMKGLLELELLEMATYGLE